MFGLTKEDESLLRKIMGYPKQIDGIEVVDGEREIYNALMEGKTVLHWELGNSMQPILINGEYCRIEPVKPEDINVGDAVFCGFKFQGQETYMVHRCIDIVERNGHRYFKIGTTGDTVYGWTSSVYGKATSTNIINMQAIQDYLARENEF